MKLAKFTALLLAITVTAVPVVAISAGSQGCTKQELADANAAVQAALPLEQCVVTQIEGGNENPVAIGVACGGIAATTVVAIAAAFDNATPPDASSTQASRVHVFVARRSL